MGGPQLVATANQILNMQSQDQLADFTLKITNTLPAIFDTPILIIYTFSNRSVIFRLLWGAVIQGGLHWMSLPRCAMYGLPLIISLYCLGEEAGYRRGALVESGGGGGGEGVVI